MYGIVSEVFKSTGLLIEVIMVCGNMILCCRGSSQIQTCSVLIDMWIYLTNIKLVETDHYLRDTQLLTQFNIPTMSVHVSENRSQADNCKDSAAYFTQLGFVQTVGFASLANPTVRTDVRYQYRKSAH